MTQETVVELKAISKELADKLVKKLKLQRSRAYIEKEIQRYYDKGVTDTEVALDMNFTRDPERLSLVTDNAFQLVKDLDSETKLKLQKELRLGLINLESNTQIAQRIKDVMETSIVRARVIARTESVRAYNVGALDAARQSGIVQRKEWLAADDERTCPTCGGLHGSVVRVDQKFEKDGEVFDMPPAHPNCRCTLIWLQQ